MKDQIIEELWQAKDQIAKEFNNDINKLASALRKKEKKDKRVIKTGKTQIN